MTVTLQAPAASTLPLPRLLFLHGGGTNGQIFRLQCRALLPLLAPHFRPVFLDAPSPSPPHDAISAVYGDLGPFYRWLRWLPDHPDREGDVMAAEIRAAVRAAMDRDEGTGEWVGVVGFSQGAKIAASLLWAQERAAESGEPGSGHGAVDMPRFRFGVFMAGSAPVVRLDYRLPDTPHIADANTLSLAYTDFPRLDEVDDSEGSNGKMNCEAHRLGTPTLHVHGLQDPAIARHRMLLRGYCRPGTTRLIEWQGSHRVPIKSDDVNAVVTKILDIAKETGVL